MVEDLSGMRIAILAGDGVDEAELLEPWSQLQEAGAIPTIVSATLGSIRVRNGGRPGLRVAIDEELRATSGRPFGGVVIVGDYESTERLRADPAASPFLRSFFRHGKPVAALDHGAALVLEVARVYGRRLTCSSALRDDLDYAGAHWLDRPVVVDGNLITGRGRDDTAQFSMQLVRTLYKLRERRHGVRRRYRMAMRRWRSFWTHQRASGSDPVAPHL
jgi:protease I